jgi:hypothetical protein
MEIKYFMSKLCKRSLYDLRNRRGRNSDSRRAISPYKENIVWNSGSCSVHLHLMKNLMSYSICTDKPGKEKAEKNW